MVQVVVVRYGAATGTTRDSAARFAGEVIAALVERSGPTALHIDLMAMVDPSRAWLDELLNRRLVPYCRERGVAVTLGVSTSFVEEQVEKALDTTSARLTEVRRHRTRGPADE